MDAFSAQKIVAGNLLSWNDMTGVFINFISKTKVRLKLKHSNVTAHISDLSEIILSDDILIAAGFFEELPGEFRHSKVKRFKVEKQNSGEYMFYAHKPIFILHAHHLQNIFFQLENQELIVALWNPLEND